MNVNDKLWMWLKKNPVVSIEVLHPLYHTGIYSYVITRHIKDTEINVDITKWIISLHIMNLNTTSLSVSLSIFARFLQ